MIKSLFPSNPLLLQQNLQAEACQLKTKMSEIQKDIFQVHKETSASMANLERLDSMKNKLQVNELTFMHYEFCRICSRN